MSLPHDLVKVAKVFGTDPWPPFCASLQDVCNSCYSQAARIYRQQEFCFAVRLQYHTDNLLYAPHQENNVASAAAERTSTSLKPDSPHQSRPSIPLCCCSSSVWRRCLGRQMRRWRTRRLRMKRWGMWATVGRVTWTLTQLAFQHLD